MRQLQLHFISEGFRKILLSKGVKELLQQEADVIKDRATANAVSGEFGTRVWYGSFGKGRYVASINTMDYDAAKAEAEDKALSKAVK